MALFVVYWDFIDELVDGLFDGLCLQDLGLAWNLGGVIGGVIANPITT